jgi:TetR/AcrR family transcriptional repressor of nem operon
MPPLALGTDLIQNKNMKTIAPLQTGGARSPGRPREFDIDEALDRAIDVFRERGYHGTSMSDLVEGMGLTRGSVYKAFTDKRGIFLAAYDRYAGARGEVTRRALEIAGSGRGKIRALFDSYARLSLDVDGRKGCLVVATATELSVIDGDMAERVAASFERNRELLKSLIREGKLDGSVDAEVDEDATAESLLCLLQGMRLVGKTGPAPAAIARVVDVVMKTLD